MEEEYIDIENYFTEELYSKEHKKITKIQKNEKSNKRELLLFLLSLISSFDIVDGVLNIPQNKIKEITKEINAEIDRICSEEIINTTQETNDILIDTIDTGYNMNSYILSIGSDDYIPTILDEDIKNNIMNEKIKGKNHEDRISTNKTNLFDIIKSDINSFLLGIFTLDILKTKLETNLDINNYNTGRLIKDQISRKFNQMKIQWFNDNGIKKKKYNSVMCPTTCGVCAEMNGRIFDVNDNTIQIPRHVNCYCYWSTVVENWNYDGKNPTWDDFLKWNKGR